MNYYSWDEISDELQHEEDMEDLRKRSNEIGMLFQYLMPNGVAVFATDRHFGLECWADSPTDAAKKFEDHHAYVEFHHEPTGE